MIKLTSYFSSWIRSSPPPSAVASCASHLDNSYDRDSLLKVECMHANRNKLDNPQSCARAHYPEPGSHYVFTVENRTQYGNGWTMKQNSISISVQKSNSWSVGQLRRPQNLKKFWSAGFCRPITFFTMNMTRSPQPCNR